MQAPPPIRDVPGPDRGAASFGLIVGTLISFGISQIPDDLAWKPVLVTLGPAIGVSLSVLWSQMKATIVQTYQEEQEMADIQAAQYNLRQQRESGTLSPGAIAIIQDELDHLSQDEIELITRRVRRRRQQRAGQR